jgi:hypothetical protein
MESLNCSLFICKIHDEATVFHLQTTCQKEKEKIQILQVIGLWGFHRKKEKRKTSNFPRIFFCKEKDYKRIIKYLYFIFGS